MGGIDQVAIGTITPAVVRAAEILGIAGMIIDQAHPAVLADVVKGLHRLLAVAGEQQTLRAYIEHHIVAGLGEIRHVHRSNPAFGPNGAPFAAIPVTADIALF